MWDVIVIGSGIGGLAAAAALGRKGPRVLVLEQHGSAGGQTQVFRRGGWTFPTGVHYLAFVGGKPGLEGQFGRHLDWLTEGAIRFAPLANPYDIVRLPGFEFAIAHPETSYRADLRERFPGSAAEIEGWFAACASARQAAFAMFARHGLHSWAERLVELATGRDVERWANTTVSSELARIGDERLRAVLGSRWADYGSPPDRAPFLEHALVTGAYNSGAFYPVGGPERFAELLIPLVEAARGELRLNCRLHEVLVENGRAVGVICRQGNGVVEERAEHVIAAMDASGLAGALPAEVAPRGRVYAAWPVLRLPVSRA